MIEGEENRIPISKRTIISYLLYLGPPFFITFIWLLIPVNTYTAFTISNAIYFSVAFFAWMAFFDMSIPGCRWTASLITYVLFLAPLIAFFYLVRNSPYYRNLQLSFFLISAIRLVAIVANYFIYVTYRRRKEENGEQYDPLVASTGPEYEQFVENSEKEAKLSWSRWIAYKFCFIESIDSDSVEKAAVYRQDAKELVETKTATYKNLFILCLYELAIVAAWMWLDAFTVLVVRKEYFSSTVGAALSVAIFQISKIVVTAIIAMINNGTVNSPYGSLEHFTLFQVQLMFLLYYRTLFIKYAEWSTTIVAAVMVVVIDVVYYLGRMSRKFYRARFFTLPNWLEYKGITTKYPFVLKIIGEEEPGYDKFANLMCVEYFYEKSAEYYSLFTAVVFISLIRALPYHDKSFSTFAVLGDKEYASLLQRYAFLLVFEIITDIVLRRVIKKFLEINISESGRDHTISNHNVRFLFSAFVVFNLMALYVSQQVTSF